MQVRGILLIKQVINNSEKHYFEAICEIENDKYETKSAMIFRAYDEVAQELHTNAKNGTKLLVNGELIEVISKYKIGDSDKEISVTEVGIEATDVKFVDFTEKDTEPPFELMEPPKPIRKPRNLGERNSSFNYTYDSHMDYESAEDIEEENLINWLEK